MPATCRAELEALLQTRKLDRTLVPVAGLGQPVSQVADAAPLGVAAVDRYLGGGLPMGEFSEIVGPRSSGRTSLLMSLLAAATQRDERVALIDTFDMFDPESAEASGVVLSRLLWIRGDGSTPAFPFMASRQSGTDRAIDRALKATNLVLQAGGFGVVALDLADAPVTALRSIPFTTWKRLQRVLAGHDTIAVAVGNTPLCRSAGGVSLVLQPVSTSTRVPGQWALSMPSHVFRGLDTEMRVMRVRRVSGQEDVPMRVTATARVA